VPGFLTYIHTIRHLRFIQVFYRLYYPLRNAFRRLLKINYRYNHKVTVRALHFIPFISVPTSLKENAFHFLNQSLEFPGAVNWDESRYGLLWTFNLNYFEFLHQEDPDKEMKTGLMKEFIISWQKLKTARHPYTISLRGINWVRYLTQAAGEEPALERHLYGQYRSLSRNLEFNLLGNHLLENGFSLLFAAYFFNDRSFLRKAKKILRKQLKVQILLDGAHFELSPLYHRIILVRLLDSINLITNNQEGKEDKLLAFLIEQAQKMLVWMNQMTLANGELSHFNDSTTGLYPSPDEISAYAERLGIQRKEGLPLNDSGYRIFRKGSYELVCDIGNIGPDYQPGHAHSDTFGFELYINSEAVIIDTGTSSYEQEEVRDYERSTRAHNTVEVNGLDQSEVWAAFRVARRACVKVQQEKEDFIAASHNGYNRIGLIHQRSFRAADNSILINDELQGRKECKARFYLHFAPGVQVSTGDQGLRGKNFEINFTGQSSVEMKTYQKAEGFNRRVEAKLAVVEFEKKLESEIKIVL